ncbi:PAS domain-containing protein [Hydrogenophaga sp. PAMC20947]|uniref:PAS domain-containing sensor histidine kinase n=1 Tax=Hydrogenophaga sp. PAMC20947 TaxID=2565558 RepID=UPI001448126C|nr:PAS domain-containing protein [Hydrogenophaga sp. PAMC20947]
MAERLQASQAHLDRLTQLVNRSSLVVIEWRNAPGWPVMFVGARVAQWGYSPGDFTEGRFRYNDLIHPDDEPRVNKEAANRFAMGPDEYRQEYRLRRADGHWAWIDDRTNLERNAQGEVVGLSGILLDITDQKEAEAAHVEQTELLRLFYDLPFIGMAISSPADKRWLHVNDRLCKILGYPRETLLQSSWSDITHPDDLQANVALFEGMVSGASNAYTMRKRFLRPDGSAVHTDISVRAVKHADGRLKHMFTTVQDVTERLDAEAQAQDYKAMLEQAEALVQLGSWSGDSETGQTRISAQLFRNIGLEPADQLPTDEVYLAQLHPEDRALVAADMARNRAGLPVGELVFRTDPALGPMRWLGRTVRTIDRQAQGLKPLHIGTLQDITATVHAEARLKALNQELEHRVSQRTEELRIANQELEAFTYTVSHDLKAPLRGIDGYSQLLMEEYGEQLDAEGQQFVARIRSGVEQMGELIADLLDYAHLERRAMSAQSQALRPLVDKVVAGYQLDIEAASVAVRVDVGSLNLAVDADGMALVLRNLIGNAIKFCAASEHPSVEVGAGREDEHIRIWVRDNGVGFDMKYHDRIFGIFQRLHRSEEFPGTGVGLALVAKAVQRMGGRVWAESEPGHGATFFLEFSA